MPERERRSFAATELRYERRQDAAPVIRGHAAVFDQLSADLGGFRERIARGAFARSIMESDVRALINHDETLILGRNLAGTLRLSEDSKGLAVEIDPPATSFAEDIAASIERGDITGMSFGFDTRDARWEELDGEWVRTLLDVKLWDVSVVTYPAYPQTDVALRSLAEHIGAGHARDAPPDQQSIQRQLGLMRRRLQLAQP